MSAAARIVGQVSTAAPIHPPKIETFDVTTMTNTDPKGYPRAVEEYREESFGLYVARPAPGRADFGYLESWLLPELGLRITDFWFLPGHERDQDFYLDVVRIERSGRRWRSEDHYLDLVVRSGRGVELLDVDELLAAVTGGMLPAAAAERALRIACRTAEALARHGYSLRAWLSAMDIRLTWRRR